jgi:hypothetical protein
MAQAQAQARAHATVSWATLRGRRMVVYASKLAALAGLHPYQPQQELLDELRHALTGEGERAETEEERDRRVVAELGEGAQAAVQEALGQAEALLAEPVGAAQAEKVVAAIAGRLDALGATEGVTQEAVAVVRRALYTANGKSSEASIREAACDARAVAKDDRFRVSAAPWLRVGDVDVHLGGRLDGYDAERREVVEIKTRQRRFLGVPRYERVQLLAYCFVCGVRAGRLIESFAGERRQHEVAFDEGDELWVRVADAVRDALPSFSGRCAPAKP